MALHFSKNWPLVTSAQIDAFERDYSLELPYEYKIFLMTVNDGQSSSDLCFQVPSLQQKIMLGGLNGISNSAPPSVQIPLLMEEFEYPNRWVPLGDDPGGNPILLSTTQTDFGRIYYWDKIGLLSKHTPADIHLISEDFSSFLESLIDC